ncbi:hypothetical protein [Mycolicibacterium baixiangningiae]|uniref:hypothetical protein n=1 Tax=Mycolicibacterium baixiangningiae TaxID=2761578 RepID=UPI0018D0BE59|nr:hypothetical protein [Mycolicibacterium baixiangningiae]
MTATATAMTMGLTAPAAGALTLPGFGPIPGTDGVELPGAALADLSPTEILDLGSVLDLVTTGPPFGLAALFGVNLGYVPALPSLIVDEVTSTEPGLDLGALLGLLAPGLPALPLPVASGVRIPIVVGFGLGSLATGLAYPEIRDYFASEDQRDVLTILPLILLRNWGRADGGIAARFAPLLDPLAQLFGYESVVSPDVANDADFVTIPPIPILGFPGLDIPVGGLVPIKVDATVEYDTFSDFPAWPNPVSLANSVAAGLFPTYILRGGDVGALAPQLAAALPEILGGLLDEDGAINIFLTVPSDRQPILEPFRYPFDVANFFTAGAFGFTNPFADAVEPAIKILGNLGYTNVVQNPTAAQIAAGLEPYDRDFSNNYGQDHAPFFTFPENVDWAQVPEDVINALVEGFTDAFFFGGIPGVNNPPDGIYRNPIDVLGELGSLLQNLPTLPIGLPTGSTTAITAEKFTPPPVNEPQIRKGATQLTVDVNTADKPADEIEELQEGLEPGGEKEPTVHKPGTRHPSLIGGLREAGENVRGAVEDGAERFNDAGERIRNTLTGGRTTREPADTKTPEKQDAKKDQEQNASQAA